MIQSVWARRWSPRFRGKSKNSKIINLLCDSDTRKLYISAQHSETTNVAKQDLISVTIYLLLIIYN